MEKDPKWVMDLEKGGHPTVVKFLAKLHDRPKKEKGQKKESKENKTEVKKEMATPTGDYTGLLEERRQSEDARLQILGVLEDVFREIITNHGIVEQLKKIGWKTKFDFNIVDQQLTVEKRGDLRIWFRHIWEKIELDFSVDPPSIHFINHDLNLDLQTKVLGLLRLEVKQDDSMGNKVGKLLKGKLTSGSLIMTTGAGYVFPRRELTVINDNIRQKLFESYNVPYLRKQALLQVFDFFFPNDIKKLHQDDHEMFLKVEAKLKSLFTIKKEDREIDVRKDLLNAKWESIYDLLNSNLGFVEKLAKYNPDLSEWIQSRLKLLDTTQPSWSQHLNLITVPLQIQLATGGGTGHESFQTQKDLTEESEKRKSGLKGKLTQAFKGKGPGLFKRFGFGSDEKEVEAKLQMLEVNPIKDREEFYKYAEKFSEVVMLRHQGVREIEREMYLVKNLFTFTRDEVNRQDERIKYLIKLLGNVNANVKEAAHNIEVAAELLDISQNTDMTIQKDIVEKVGTLKSGWGLVCQWCGVVGETTKKAGTSAGTSVLRSIMGSS